MIEGAPRLAVVRIDALVGSAARTNGNRVGHGKNPIARCSPSGQIGGSLPFGFCREVVAPTQPDVTLSN